MFKSILNEANSNLILRIIKINKIINQPSCQLRDKVLKKDSKDKNGKNIVDQWLEESEDERRQTALEYEDRKLRIKSICAAAEHEYNNELSSNQIHEDISVSWFKKDKKIKNVKKVKFKKFKE